MPKLLHSVAVQNQDPAADAVITHDLPVNPLSIVIINLKPLNETSTLANFQAYLGIADAINQIEILHRGQAVVSMTGRDAAIMAMMARGFHVFPANNEDADNERRSVPIPICLGRKPYDPKSCFPATRRGELTIHLDVDVAAAGYDDLQYTIETVEILDTTPTEYERQVQLTTTWGATGLNDLDLPIGQLYRGLLLFGTTVFTGATPAPSWGRIELLKDNQEIAYSSIDWETANTLAGLLKARHPAWDEHIHRVDATAAVATEPTDTPISATAPFESYAYLPLDPTDDDAYSIDTAGMSRFHLRADAETADAVRVIPRERVKV